jgi:hypothetical protein
METTGHLLFVTETADSAEAPHSQYAEGYPF